VAAVVHTRPTTKRNRVRWLPRAHRRTGERNKLRAASRLRDTAGRPRPLETGLERLESERSGRYVLVCPSSNAGSPPPGDPSSSRLPSSNRLILRQGSDLLCAPNWPPSKTCRPVSLQRRSNRAHDIYCAKAAHRIMLPTPNAALQRLGCRRVLPEAPSLLLSACRRELCQSCKRGADPGNSGGCHIGHSDCVGYPSLTYTTASRLSKPSFMAINSPSLQPLLAPRSVSPDIPTPWMEACLYPARASIAEGAT
jgi:hypothetical protein